MDNAQTPAPLQVTFYMKAGCHLCENVREMLDEIATQWSYELTEIDIRRDFATFEQYRYRIPIVMLNATIAAEGRIDYSELLHAFNTYK